MAKKRWIKKNVFQGSQCPEVVNNCPGTINLENIGGDDYFVCSRNSTHMIKVSELTDDHLDDATVDETATKPP